MKVQSRRSSNKKRLTRVLLISIVIIIMGWFMPTVFSFVGEVVMKPFHATSSWLRESNSLVPTFIRERQSLVQEIEELKTEVEIASRSDVTQRRLLEENNRLRALLGATEENRIAAGVIARPDDLPYDYIQIDQGAEAGIEIGAPVFVGRDIVIGLVVYTAKNYSFVSLFTTPGFEATVFVSGPDVVATMEGVGGGIARVKMPQGIAMNVGNLVHVPSIEPGVFGRISHLENEATQPEQFGYIAPQLGIANIFTVAVGNVSQISRSADELDERIKDELLGSLVVEGIVFDVSSATSSATSTADVATTTEVINQEI